MTRQEPFVFEIQDDEEPEEANENENQEEINIWLLKQMLKQSREKQHNAIMEASEKSFFEKLGIDRIEP